LRGKKISIQRPIKFEGSTDSPLDNSFHGLALLKSIFSHKIQSVDSILLAYKRKITSSNNEGKIVRLNVGGTRYDVSRDTMERCEGSMLASLISKDWKERNSPEPILIDCSGRLFEYVLEYLRTNEVYLPTLVDRTALEKEFSFYGIEVDMKNVHERNGRKYIEEIAPRIASAQKDLDLLTVERLAIETAAFVELKYVQSRPYQISLPDEVDDSALLQKYPEFFRERLLDRGLLFQSIGVDRNKSWYIKVQSVDT
jgi:hypothetical protein